MTDNRYAKPADLTAVAKRISSVPDHVMNGLTPMMEKRSLQLTMLQARGVDPAALFSLLIIELSAFIAYLPPGQNERAWAGYAAQFLDRAIDQRAEEAGAKRPPGATLQ